MVFKELCQHFKRIFICVIILIIHSPNLIDFHVDQYGVSYREEVNVIIKWASNIRCLLICFLPLSVININLR